MQRLGSIARLVGLIFMLATGVILFSNRTAVADSVVVVTSLGALNANDSVAWSQLGVDGTSLASTFGATSVGSISVTGTLNADGSLASVVCPASSCSWGFPGAGFSAGDTIIWTSDTANGGTGPLKLAFGAGVKGVGAFIQADGPGKFTAQVQAFNGNVPLKTFKATSNSNGDALFLGVLDNTAAHITSVVYSLTACTGVCTDFAIDTLFINAGSGGGGNTSMLGAPAQTNFGNVDASSSSKARKVSIANKGMVDAMVGQVSIPSGFAIVAGSDSCSGQTVAPKKSCSLMLLFSPTVPGPLSGTVSAPYNGGTATVSVSGNGTHVSVKGPSSVSFAPVAAGLIGTQKLVSIANLSPTATVRMGTPNFSGPFAKGSTDTCSNAGIPPKGKCTIGIEFAPLAGSASKSKLPGTLGFDFTYGSNPGSTPTISLSGVVK